MGVTRCLVGQRVPVPDWWQRTDPARVRRDRVVDLPAPETECRMLIAPTEPTEFLEVGERSSLPEKYGVDFLFAHDGKWFGVQRKEHSDFVASVQDGRLSKEIGQMQQLSVGMLLIEGAGKWTNDGELIHGWAKWNKGQEYSYLWSVQSRGVWVDRSGGKRETIQVLGAFERWVRKASHKATFSRPGATSTWGKAGSREWAIHLLCGFDGVGPEIATRILDGLGMPLAWTVDEKGLMQVEGIGKKRASKLIEALNHEPKGEV